MKKTAILSTLLLLAMNSCSNEEIFNEDSRAIFERQISVVAEDLTSSNGTRTTYTEGETGYHFAWTEGDALGIFPESGHQTDFPISNGYGTNTAVFDGGKWALRPNESYAAYYPLIHDFDLDPTAISVDYTGQVQSGNGSTAHLSAYDYMASTFTEVDAKGNVYFKLQHLGCLVQFKLTMPEADSYSALNIESDKTKFITSAKYSLSDNAHAFQNKQESSSFTIGLTNVSTTADEKTLTITAMFAPVDLSDSKLILKVTGGSRLYTFEVDGQDLTPGRAVSNSLTTIPYVTFKAADTQTFRISKCSIVNDLEYSLNNGEWTKFGSTVTLGGAVTFGGENGDLRLRGMSSCGTAKSVTDYCQISFSGSSSVACSGDIRTLVNYENYEIEEAGSAMFFSLFSDCTSLTTAPELPFTTLSSNCYYRMFSGCTSLSVAPELPATALAYRCYQHMFDGCSSLANAPTLSADILADECYSSMFEDCTSLLTASELPATALAKGCYNGMFLGCTSLTTAPSLSVTTLADNCYSRMFSGCTALTSAPELPATALAKGCYDGMFSGCTALTSAPELPATILANSCYSSMFEGCTALATAPELPVTILANFCYSSMFKGCTALTIAPTLPAITLTSGCYSSMFEGCTSLATAPLLPAAKLEYFSYYHLFYGCSHINFVKMMATDINAERCFEGWLSGVATTGTLVENADATFGNAIVPLGWSIVKVYEHNGHEYVDLGLTGSNGKPVYWATCNIGADSPADYGDYYQWGGHYPANDTWCTPFSYFDTYDEGETFQKYRSDYLTTLASEDDAASVQWEGNWRMPSRKELEDLRAKCNWEKTTMTNSNGESISGYKVSNKSDSSKFIFLPAAGLRSGDFNQEGGITGRYWTNTLNTSDEKKAYYYLLEVGEWSSLYELCSEEFRYNGLSVRAVCVLNN